MRKSAKIAVAKTAGSNGTALEAQVNDTPAGFGPFALIARGVRNLVRPGPRGSAAGGAAGTYRETGAGPGAHRSAMDAGITGGILLPSEGSRDDRLRR